jgi:hypothetical protein
MDLNEDQSLEISRSPFFSKCLQASRDLINTVPETVPRPYGGGLSLRHHKVLPPVCQVKM